MSHSTNAVVLLMIACVKLFRHDSLKAYDLQLSVLGIDRSMLLSLIP